MKQRLIKIRECESAGCIKKALWQWPGSIAGRIWPGTMDAALLQLFIRPLPHVDWGNMENLGDRPQLGARTFRMGPARDGLWRYKPDSWYRVCDHRDCFASLAMTPQMAVIARSGATKQSRCEALWRESSVWFRPLGAGAVDQHNVSARQQQRLPAIAWRGQAVLCNLIIFLMLGCGSPLAASGVLSKQYAEGGIPRVLDLRIASSRTFRRCKFELLG